MKCFVFFNGPFFIAINRTLVKGFIRAVLDGDVNKVVDIVDAGMPVDIDVKFHGRALECAAANNRTDVVRFLLQRGANINIQDPNGWTVLHHASYSNSTDVFRLLLQHGASRDVKCYYKSHTPIDVARGLSHEEAVRLLTQY